MSNWLVSYPRSGNTWCRYCIEFLSKQPSKGYEYKNRIHIDQSLNNFIDLGVDLEKDPIVIKRHWWPSINDSDKVILILRDYKEAIIRHFKSMPSEGQKNPNIWAEQLTWYLELIQAYEETDRPKLIVYYEDLLNKPFNIMSDVLDFLEIEKNYLKEFTENIEEHKNNSLKIYEKQFPSLSKGKDINFHTKDFDKDKIKYMDEFLQNKSKELYDKYLSRYELITPNQNNS